MTFEEITEKVLSLETQEERVEFLKNYCFERLLEITGDKELVDRLRNKKINIKLMSTEEIREARKGQPHANETEGAYRSSTKTVMTPHIDNAKNIHSFVHEFMHALSHSYENEKYPEKRGIMLAGCKTIEEENVSRGYNEAVTDNIAEIILGSNSSFYQSNKKQLTYLKTMCGISDDELIHAYFQEEPWLKEEYKLNFNPNDPDDLEKSILRKFLPLNSIDLMEEIEKNHLPHLSEKTRKDTEDLIKQAKNKLLKNSESEAEIDAETKKDLDDWGCI